MSQKYVLNDHTNSQVLKKIKHYKTLQELYHFHPEFNGKPVFFFYKKTQYVKRFLIYNKKNRTFYVFDKKTSEKFSTFASWIKFLKIRKKFSGEHSALVTIFFKPNSSSFNLASLLRIEQILYQKNYNSASIVEVKSLIETNTTLKQELFSVGIRKTVNEIGILFYRKEQKIEKNLIFKWHENLISYELYVLEKSIKKINEIKTDIAIERTLSEIDKIIHYVSAVKICIRQKIKDIDFNYNIIFLIYILG